VGEALVFVKSKRQMSWAMPEHDEETADHLRALFIREMGRRKNRLSEFGMEIDVQAYIQAKISRQAAPVFVDEAATRGFRALLVLDRSGSMNDQGKLVNASRAAAILARALRFPFVALDAFGFSATPTSVELYAFDPHKEAFAAGGANGSTPTHIALRYARVRLTGKTETCHVFLVTDGAPVYATPNGVTLTTEKLAPIVRKEVDALRRRGVRVSVLLVDRDKGAPEVSDEIATLMFGPTAWRRAKTATLNESMVDLIAGEFLRYLKT
jgi:Mg-chelatase subunit ChlD